MAIPRKNPRHLIREFMTRDPYTVGTHDTLATAHTLMKEHHVRHLPVLDDTGPAGVVSERDLMAIERYHDVDPARVEIHEAMAPLPYIVTPQTPLAEVVDAMAENRYGSALVIHEGKVVGIFTTVDALRATRKLCRARQQ